MAYCCLAGLIRLSLRALLPPQQVFSFYACKFTCRAYARRDPIIAYWFAKLVRHCPPLQRNCNHKLPAVTDTALSKIAEAPAAAETAHAHGLKATQEPASVTAAEQSIWPNLRGAMALSHQLEQRRVQQEIRWLLRNPRYLERLQPRMQKYLPYLLQRTVERGLPGELALIPIVESALDPYAFSPGGASGLWQFMRPTALQYGLTIDRWYDGRRDLIAATEAALDYLEALHTRLGQWPLAIAAYNSGGARVQRAVRRANSSDFFCPKTAARDPVLPA